LECAWLPPPLFLQHELHPLIPSALSEPIDSTPPQQKSETAVSLSQLKTNF